MDKQKQIEEMKKTLDRCCEDERLDKCTFDRNCYDCYAEFLYNAGYRKIPEGAEVKRLSEALMWFIEYGSEDVCKLCVHENEACEEWHDDIPEDVEPCKFKRYSGTDACFCGIIEFFNNGGVKN